MKKFIKKIFKVRENLESKSIHNYADFWSWFVKHQKEFYEMIKSQPHKIQEHFIDELTPKLGRLGTGYFVLAGMHDDNTAELIITADGIVKNIVFCEDLIDAAPDIEGWKFTALKPGIGEGCVISMNEYEFNVENMNFYSNNDQYSPDEIDITVQYKSFKKTDEDQISQGVFIFLDNFLGELSAITLLDMVSVEGNSNSSSELIPMYKLKDYLIWREKEFVEKYDEVRYDTDHDIYNTLQGESEEGNPIIAVANQTLLEWDAKPSHPWILMIEIEYDEVENGLPNENTYNIMEEFERELTSILTDYDGYLNVARETGEELRVIYFACKEFRNSSKVTKKLIDQYQHKLKISYSIYKDKYWRTFDRYQPEIE